VFINSSLTNIYRLCHGLIKNNTDVMGFLITDNRF